MCGIVGILGREPVAEEMVEALKRLEYRGYDSAGIATLEGGHLDAPPRRRQAEEPRKAADQRAARTATTGIGHTRWATHGQPNESQRASARDRQGRGRAQRHHREFPRAARRAADEGPHVRDRDRHRGRRASRHATRWSRAARRSRPSQAALPRLRGAFALAFLFEGEDDLLVGARKGSPLAVGYGEGEMYLGSDAIALAPFTDTISYLEDGDWAVLHRDGAESPRRERQQGRARRCRSRRPRRSWSTRATIAISWRRRSTSSPRSSATRSRTISTWRPSACACRRTAVRLRASIDRITISACGTAYYAGLVAKYWFERFARLPVEIDVASEFRYREAPFAPGGLAIFVSQSGETADTLATLRYAKEQKQHVALDRQRADLDHRARERRRDADARRPGDRRRLHQGVHLPARGARVPRDRGRPRARHAVGGRRAQAGRAR